jgi:CarboxypepD_reg-like domain
MKEEKGNIKYTAEDIRKYLNGQFSDKEMQALEKAALEDPFLADAIEGIEESRNHPGSFESGVDELKNRLTQRIREKNRKSKVIFLFSKWKIAASVLFIIGTTVFTTTYLTNKNRQSKIANSLARDAETKKTISRPSMSADSTDSITTGKLPEKPVPDIAAISPDKKSPVLRKSFPKKRVNINQVTTLVSDRKTTELPTISLPRILSDTNALAIATAPVTQDKDLLSEAPKYENEQENATASGIARYRSSSKNYIKGVVTDDNGKPIPFADVSIKGTDSRTTTDINGFFKLYMSYPNLVSPVMFNSVGYNTVSANIKPDSSLTNLILLQPATTALNEVTVIGYEAAKKKDIRSSLSKSEDNQNAFQVSGWDAFKNYIYANKKNLTIDSLLKGDEIISFVINKKSELSSFKIEKSVSPEHDAETIRLIKAAPALKVVNSKKQRLRITISFN